MEAAELALFMLSACAFTVALYHPASPFSHMFPNEILRRFAMGIAMGSTAIALTFSPLGKRSGAHFNPAVTLAFLRLGKINRWDACFYILGQFTGGISGVVIATFLLGPTIADRHVNYATTQPGPYGPTASLRGGIDHLVPADVCCLAHFKYEKTCPMDRCLQTRRSPRCAKFHHYNNQRCIFRCNFETT